MSLRISGNPKGEIEVKRFYLEGVDIIYTCPKCGETNVWDDYLSYPDINKAITLSGYCNNCDYEWDEKVVLKMTLECI